jgi:propanediol dehydratase small subunit
MTTYSHSGRNIDDVTVEAACTGDLALDDIRISRETLLRQAERAERAGSLQLGINLRRAAEMTALSAEDMLAAYEALRPRRSSFAELEDLAQQLDAQDAHTCAVLVREAAVVYQRRGLLR